MAKAPENTQASSIQSSESAETSTPDQTSIGNRVKKVNEILKKGEPNNYSEDFKGYKGYKPQWVIDAINSEFSGEWGVLIVDKGERRTGRHDKDGNEIVDCWVHVRVNLAGNTVDSFASHPINKGNDYGDTMKSAQTDAMKKALAHFSIGNRAYHGLLK